MLRVSISMSSWRLACLDSVFVLICFPYSFLLNNKCEHSSGKINLNFVSLLLLIPASFSFSSSVPG